MSKGRPKGSLNTTTVILKDMILGALDKVGGLDYLTKQAKENPTAFLTLIGKTLPLAVDVTKTNINVTIGKYKEDEQPKPVITPEAVASIH